MRSKILSIIIAVAMVFSTAAVSFATTGTSTTLAEKVRLDVKSGETNVSVVATEDYVVTAEIDGDSVDQAAVTATLAMTNVAALGIEGTRTGSFTLETGIAGDGDVSLRGNMAGLKAFQNAKVKGSVNGLEFAYEIAKDAASNGTTYDKWVATPDDAAAVSAAWQELTSYVTTGTGAEDSQAVIEAGTIIQIGKEAIIFEKALNVNNLNVKGDDYTQTVLDSVKYIADYGKAGEYKVYVPAGSMLQVGASIATLETGAWIEAGGFDNDAVKALEESKPLEQIKKYANDRDYAGMLQQLVPMMGSLIAAADGQTLTVDITTDPVPPTEKVRLDVASGETTITVAATDDYVVTAEIDGDSVDQAMVKATLTMTDVAALGIEGTRTGSFTLETGIAGDGDVSLRGNMAGLKAFQNAKVKGSVNGLEFAYEIAKDAASNGTTYDKWVATPDDAAAVSAAWQELTSYVTTGTGAEDNQAVIERGTIIQIGKEAIIFNKALNVNDLNVKGDDYTQTVLDSVKYIADYGKAGEYKVYVPAGSMLQVGASIATLETGAWIEAGGFDNDAVKALEESKPLKQIKKYANDRDYAGMLQQLVPMMGSLIAAADGQTLTVDITTDPVPPTEKVRLDVASGETTISVAATDDYVVTAEIDGDSVDQAMVKATLTMIDVAALGIEGTRTGSFTLETGIAGDGDVSLRGNMAGLKAFQNAKVEASVNGIEFAYDIAKDDIISDNKTYDKWVATPDDAAAVSTAWQELAAHVATSTAAEDNNAVIKAGTIIQVGKEAFVFEEDLNVDNLNVKGDDYTQTVLDAVKYVADYSKKSEYKVYMPAGSYLQIGSSVATLSVGAWITVDGFDKDAVKALEESKPLKQMQKYANDRDYAGMLQQLVPMMGKLIAAADGQTLTVDIVTDCADGEETVKCPVCDKCQDDCNCFDPANRVERIFGLDRYATSLKTADALKLQLGVKKFDTIIVARGDEFADALTGSYLATEKDAPIILIDKDNIFNKKATKVVEYINENLTKNGTVYVLGGDKVVPDSWLKGTKVEPVRLGGLDRFETNLAILGEAGVEAGTEILVCTAFNFADSLSASATGMPILLVDDKLKNNQIENIAQIPDATFTIIGGNKVVTSSVEKSLKKYGDVKRLYGENRYETSVDIADEYFEAPEYAVLATGKDFADGLSAAPLAYAMEAPLILTTDRNAATAAKYAKSEGIEFGKVMGGTAVINNKTVKAFFGDDKDIVVFK